MCRVGGTENIPVNREGSAADCTDDADGSKLRRPGNPRLKHISHWTALHR
jgi:hypothetical protein